MSENQKQTLTTLGAITERTDKALSNLRGLNSRVYHVVDTIVGQEATPGPVTHDVPPDATGRVMCFTSDMHTLLEDIETLTSAMNKSLDRL